MKIGTEVIFFFFNHGQGKVSRKRRGVVVDTKLGRLKIKFDDQPKAVWVNQENCEVAK